MEVTQKEFRDVIRAVMSSAIEDGWSVSQVVDCAKEAVLEWEEEMEKLDEPIQPYRKG